MTWNYISQDIVHAYLEAMEVGDGVKDVYVMNHLAWHPDSGRVQIPTGANR